MLGTTCENQKNDELVFLDPLKLKTYYHVLDPM